MAKKITTMESETLVINLLWGLGFFWIALSIKDYVVEKYGVAAAFWIGLGIIIFIAYWFDLRFPYWIKRQS